MTSNIESSDTSDNVAALPSQAANPLQTYALGIEFNGANYRGWQRQQEVLCVQQVVEETLSKIANEPIEVVAAGRTDAGVHGGNMLAHLEPVPSAASTTGYAVPATYCRMMLLFAGYSPCPRNFMPALVPSPVAIAISL